MATVARKPVHRGEREVSRKTIAQGRPDASAEPVCSCAFFYVQLAHETAGAARTRSSLRPLLVVRAEVLAKLGHIIPRECGVASLSRHRPRKRAIQYAAAYWLKQWRLWNTGSPSRATTSENCLKIEYGLTPSLRGAIATKK